MLFALLLFLMCQSTCIAYEDANSSSFFRSALTEGLKSFALPVVMLTVTDIWLYTLLLFNVRT